MSNYYYFASTLPLLFFHHGQPPLSYSSFIQDCQRLVDTSDLMQIRWARLNAAQFFPNAISTLQKWQRADFALRNELVKIRAKNLSLDPQPFLHPESIDPSWVNPLKESIEDFSPLRAEMHIMEFQWKILDELGVGHQFDLHFLVIYALKLQLLQRKASFNKEAGERRLQEIISGGNTSGY